MLYNNPAGSSVPAGRQAGRGVGYVPGLYLRIAGGVSAAGPIPGHTFRVHEESSGVYRRSGVLYISYTSADRKGNRKK